MTTIGRYEIIDEIGRGGMATVYRAFDPRFEREVAIKTLPREFLHDPQFRQRFEREAKIVAGLQHPAIVPVFDFGDEDGRLFLVMRYMEGGSLADRLAAGPLSLPGTARILQRLAPSLDAAHQRGFIHRDLKPGNILFDEWDEPYLTDFGIVKMVQGSPTALTVTGGILGTPAYMSPEQARGVDLDGRSDIYSLGVIFFEMVTGEQPYKANTPLGLALMHVNEPVPRILESSQEQPPGAQDIIDRAMAKQPDDRYATAGALAAAVTNLAAGKGEVPAAPPVAMLPPADQPVVPTGAEQPPVQPPSGDLPPTTLEEPPVNEPAPKTPSLEKPQPARRSPWLWVGGAILLVLLGIGLYWIFGRQGPEAPAGLVDELLPSQGQPVDSPAEAIAQATETAVPASGPGDNKPKPPSTATAPRPTEPPAAGPNFLGRALAGEFAGSEVGVFLNRSEADVPLFQEALASFSADTGIQVNFTASSGEFQSRVNALVEAGNPPDIALFAMPTQLQSLVAGGHIVDLREFLPEAELGKRYTQGWIDSATFRGPDGQEVLAGVWYLASPKDLVWYPPADFAAAGYEPPATWDELLALGERMAADGRVPWCIGIESGVATGWVATDWIEAIMLRTTGADNYDAWVAGDLPFSSPEVRRAAEKMTEIWFNPDQVLGGRDQILTEFFGDSPSHMFENPPGCWLHKQAPFIRAFFPEGLQAGVDYDFFPLPRIVAAYGQPQVITGEIAAMFQANDRPEVRALMEYFSTGGSSEALVRAGIGLSPNQGSDPSWAPDDINRRAAAILQEAAIVRFDASDIMPAEVGARSFWSEMADYVAGAVDLDTALRQIDQSWPR